MDYLVYGKESADRVKAEFWAFLRSRGFPTEINDETIQWATEKIEVEAVSGKRLRLRRWSWFEGGLHSDDVAIVKLVAEYLGLREGIDWDWELEPDNYHFSIAYVDSPRTDELSRLVDLYHDATMVLLQVRLQAEEKTSEELQQFFREEWQRLHEEKQRLHDETAKRLREAFKQIGF